MAVKMIKKKTVRKNNYKYNNDENNNNNNNNKAYLEQAREPVALYFVLCSHFNALVYLFKLQRYIRCHLDTKASFLVADTRL